MKSSLPPLHTLRAFEAVARLCSFTLAAKELHLTHSAISHQMRALEESLQSRLIDRSPRAVSLTAKGRQFLLVVRTALQLLGDVSSAIRGSRTHTLRLNVLPSFAARWLLPRLGDFLTRHPHIDLEISATQAVVDLDAAGANVAIRYGDGAWSGVHSERLFEETVFPVASPAFIRAHKLRSIGELRRVPLLRDDFHPWDGWLELAQLDAAGCTFGPLYKDSTMTLQAAENGQGVALARSFLAADALRLGRLRRIGSLSMPAGAAYFLVFPEREPIPPEVQQFVAWIREAGMPPPKSAPAPAS